MAFYQSATDAQDELGGDYTELRHSASDHFASRTPRSISASHENFSKRSLPEHRSVGSNRPLPSDSTNVYQTK